MPPQTSPDTSSAVESTDRNASPALHPLLAGLMQELPAEGQGFPAEKRKDWLDAAQVIFRFVYGKDTSGD